MNKKKPMHALPAAKIEQPHSEDESLDCDCDDCLEAMACAYN
jgi:hypothetical protein